MTLSDYQQLAARTAGGGHRRERAILGFYGEFFEAQDARGERLADELGDRAWYLAEICTSHGLKLAQCDGHHGIRHGHRGALAEARKKHLRGDYDEEEYLRRVAHAVATEWARLQQECWAARVTLDFVMERNIAKLEDRQRRGVIGGEGDDR
jgi:hypothetical protein